MVIIHILLRDNKYKIRSLNKTTKKYKIGNNFVINTADNSLNEVKTLTPPI